MGRSLGRQEVVRKVLLTEYAICSFKRQPLCSLLPPPLLKLLRVPNQVHPRGYLQLHLQLLLRQPRQHLRNPPSRHHLLQILNPLLHWNLHQRLLRRDRLLLRQNKLRNQQSMYHHLLHDERYSLHLQRSADRRLITLLLDPHPLLLVPHLLRRTQRAVLSTAHRELLTREPVYSCLFKQDRRNYEQLVRPRRRRMHQVEMLEVFWGCWPL